MKNLIATILLATSVASGSTNLDNVNYALNESNVPLDIPLNQIGWITNAEYINVSAGQVKFYRYTFQVAYLDSNDDAILQDTNFLYFDLPLNYLSYDADTTAVQLAINQLANDETFVSLPITPLFPTLGVFDTTMSYILMPGEMIQFIIPTTHTTAISQYQTAMNEVHIYNRAGVFAGLPVYTAGYIQGEADGFANGHAVGYDSGFLDGEFYGYMDGYNAGMDDAVANEMASYSWLRGLFSGLGDLLAIRLFGDITIGSIALIMLSLTLLPFIIGLVRGKD